MDEEQKIGANRCVKAILLCCALAVGCARYFELDPQSNESILSQEGKFQIGSSSMAPRLPGPRLSIDCGRCGQASEISLEDYREPALSRGHRCPFCGNSIALRCDHGRRLEINTPTKSKALKYECEICNEGTSQCGYVPGAIVEPKLVASVQRWECVLIRADDRAQPLLKRVLALPGESVEFKEGELFLNGEMFLKSIPEFRSVAVPITSLRHPVGNWKIAEERLQPPAFSQERLNLSAEQELLWEYAEPAPVHTHEKAPKDWLRAARIHDGLARNAATSTDLRFVGDFCLNIKLEEQIAVPVELDCQIGEQLITFVLVPSASSSTTLAAAPNQFILQVADEATVAFCDGRVLASALRDHSWTYSDSATTETVNRENPGSWFSIQCTGNIAIEKLELSRDLFLRSDAPRLSGGQAAMAEASHETDGYFLIGDNMVVSHDSRNGLGRVQEGDILGVIVNSE